MLSDFKICCPAFKIMLCELIYLCATLEYGYILLFRLASQRGLHPSRLCGCCSGQTAITRRQPFVATRPPGDWERPSLSFGLQALRGFQASSGPLGGTEALLESTFESQGDICWEEPRSQPSGSTRRRSRTSVSLL